ncbi:hypothetical protein V499_06596 [Pseudogymnoascus sp. VKM F-103]|nr:hypothetical protein V499_06596 [Pseudogymnoascus sp. VKM F-103]
MDIKPGNFLLDEESNLVLINWEQSDAPVTTAALEIDGTWDIEEIRSENQTTTLRYTKYTGPERCNMPIHANYHTKKSWLERMERVFRMGEEMPKSPGTRRSV